MSHRKVLFLFEIDVPVILVMLKLFLWWVLIEELSLIKGWDLNHKIKSKRHRTLMGLITVMRKINELEEFPYPHQSKLI